MLVEQTPPAGLNDAPAGLRGRGQRGARVKLLNRQDERRIANAVIADPEQHTVMDRGGAVRSIQAANVDMPEDELLALWKPIEPRAARAHLLEVPLARHARADPRDLHRARARGRPDRPAVRAAALPRARVRDLATTAGSCGGGSRTACSSPRATRATWRSTSRRIESDRPGYARVHVEVEVANFYPAIATWVARWFYVNTQSRIHVLVTHGFLRSLARLELEESAVGRFAEAAAPRRRQRRRHPVAGRRRAHRCSEERSESFLPFRRARRRKKGWRRWR